MKGTILNFLILSFFATAITMLACEAHTQHPGTGDQRKFSCIPCGSSCDTLRYSKGDTCPHCNMKLVETSSIKQSSIEPREMCSFISKEGKANVLLLDVRTVTEFEGTTKPSFGKLKNAVNIPIQELEKRMGELSDWKDKKIIVYCSHSHRSPRAGYILSQNGFKHVSNMEGGMSVWKSQVSDEECNRQIFIDQ